jgi:hypothetical protein
MPEGARVVMIRGASGCGATGHRAAPSGVKRAMPDEADAVGGAGSELSGLRPHLPSKFAQP